MMETIEDEIREKFTMTRRAILRAAGGAICGMSLSASASPLRAGSSGPARKMIMRADDVGYTDVCNMGTFLTMERAGVVTSADVMLDTPGTVDALKRLKMLPWISVGCTSGVRCPCSRNDAPPPVAAT